MAFVDRMPRDANTQERVTGNPLMLSMVASVFEIRGGVGMPTTVAELYESASDAMLARGSVASPALRRLLQAVFFEDCHRARGDIEVGLYTTAPFLAAYGAVEFFLACVMYLPLALLYGLATHMAHPLLFGATLAGMAFYFSLLSLHPSARSRF